MPPRQKRGQDKLSPARKNEIGNKLRVYSRGARNRRINFETLGYEDEETGKPWLYIKAKLDGTDFAIEKDIREDKASDEVLDAIGKDLKRMLELADEHGRSGFLNPLISKEIRG